MQGLLAKLETEDKLYFSLNEAGSKVQVTLHRSRIQVTAPLINYQTTRISLLDLTERFVKRSGLGDTFNVIHLSVSWWPTCTLTCERVTCILDPQASTPEDFHQIWVYPWRVWVYPWKISWKLKPPPKNSILFYSTPKGILFLWLTPEEFHCSSAGGVGGGGGRELQYPLIP